MPVIRRAADRRDSERRPAVQHVRVDHRRGHVTVAEKFLDGADVAAVLEQVGRERVAEGVAGGALGDARGEHSAANGALQDGLVQMMSPALAGAPVQIGALRRE